MGVEDLTEERQRSLAVAARMPAAAAISRVVATLRDRKRSL